MQGFGIVSEQLREMEGFEYILLHAQPPDLYVIRKQHRTSSTQVTPLVDYYIIRGVVYQAPDLASVLNVRLLNAVHAVRRALDEASSRGRFSLSKAAGVSWLSNEPQQSHEGPPQSAKRNSGQSISSAKQRQNDPDRPPTAFQKMHVESAIGDFVRRFPSSATTTAPIIQSGQQTVAMEASASKLPPTAQQASQDSQPTSTNVKRSKLT